jgi:2-polyprenyl-3-methyl-5-hydroxy-6-metoxy-1,4-benzoquinol methylase
MSDERSPTRFEGLTFDDFKVMALSEQLSIYEKVGFPDEMRHGREETILADITRKLPLMSEAGSVVVDIGCGCSGIPRMLIDRAARLSQELVLIDSVEMLSQLPDRAHVRKEPGYFPEGTEHLDDLKGRADAVLAYSVIQYVMRDSNVIAFFDAMLGLLAPGGAALAGDIPNASMRSRFLASDTGKEFHHTYMATDEDPEPPPTQPGDIDDGLLMGLVLRARGMGYHSYLMPQASDLPMANRREDLLVVRP